MPEYDKWRQKVDHILESGKTAHQIDLVPINQMALEARAELSTPQECVTLPQWNYFNDFVGGLRVNEFSVLSGPTGTGKTLLLANISTQLLQDGTPHFVASVETGPLDFFKRNLSVLTGRSFVGQPPSDREVTEIFAKHSELLTTNRIVYTRYENRIDHRRLLSDMLYAHETYHCKVALLDNINFFMEVGEADSAIVQMDKVVHDFVVFSKQVPMHTILVMHPKKTENSRVTSEFDIKGSSTSVQEASNVILWNRVGDDVYIEPHQNKNYMREMKFVKIRQRGGNVGKRIIFDFKHNRLIEDGCK